MKQITIQVLRLNPRSGHQVCLNVLQLKPLYQNGCLFV